jgi:hypothetical protein
MGGTSQVNKKIVGGAEIGLFVMLKIVMVCCF